MRGSTGPCRSRSTMLRRSRSWPGCGSARTSLQMFTGQLNSIVDYVAQLQELDTADVEPLAHGIEVRNVFRDDVRGERIAPRGRAWQCAQAKPGELPGPRRARVSQPRPLARRPTSQIPPGRPAVRSGSSPGTGRRLMKHATATGSPGPVERRGHHLGRGRPGLPRPGRASEAAQRVRPPRRRARPGPGPRDRRQAQGRRAARSAGGRAGGDQGRALRRGGADDLRQPDAPERSGPPTTPP